MTSWPPPAPVQPWRFFVQVPMDRIDVFADGLADLADIVSMVEVEEDITWAVEGLCAQRPEAAVIAARAAVLALACGLPEPPVTVERVPDVDWLAKVYAGFPPIRAGRFYIYGSHITEPPPAATRRLKIDAATAFGSGEHGSTYGCLKAIDGLARGRPRRRVMDMGCGSGILGLAAARVWPGTVDLVDIDPESVRVTRLNARINRVQQRIRSQAGNGWHTALARRGAKYDLIIANILARPLMKMARQLSRRLAPGGRVVLAGLLKRQARAVAAAHRYQGLHLVRRRPVGNWMTLELKRRI